MLKTLAGRIKLKKRGLANVWKDIVSISWRAPPEGETAQRVGRCTVPPATRAFNSLTFLAQGKHFLGDTLGGVSLLVTKTAQIELKSGGV